MARHRRGQFLSAHSSSRCHCCGYGDLFLSSTRHAAEFAGFGSQSDAPAVRAFGDNALLRLRLRPLFTAAHHKLYASMQASAVRAKKRRMGLIWAWPKARASLPCGRPRYSNVELPTLGLN